MKIKFKHVLFLFKHTYHITINILNFIIKSKRFTCIIKNYKLFIYKKISYKLMFFCLKTLFSFVIVVFLTTFCHTGLYCLGLPDIE